MATPPPRPALQVEVTRLKQVVLRSQIELGCRKWGCNKWGLKGCLAALPGNRPKSAFFALFLPFLTFSGGSEEHLGNPENGGQRPFPQISSDFLKPHLLNPHLRHSSRGTTFLRLFRHFGPGGPGTPCNWSLQSQTLPLPHRGVREGVFGKGVTLIHEVLRGNTIRGNRARNFERKMAL